MPYLLELLLFLSPFLLFFVWSRLNPTLAMADPRLVRLAVIGLVLALGGAVWFGLSGRHEPGQVYVPATLAPDHAIRPGHQEPAR